MKPHFLIFFYILLGMFFTRCGENKSSNVTQQEITFQKEGELSIINSTGEIVADFEIEIADTPYERQTGLMYRKVIQQNHAMLFVFEDSQLLNFYMKNTQIPLDLIFINDQMEIVSIYSDAQPFDQKGISSKFNSKYVLEINARESDRLAIASGMKIKFNRL